MVNLETQNPAGLVQTIRLMGNIAPATVQHPPYLGGRCLINHSIISMFNNYEVERSFRVFCQRVGESLYQTTGRIVQENLNLPGHLPTFLSPLTGLLFVGYDAGYLMLLVIGHLWSVEPVEPVGLRAAAAYLIAAKIKASTAKARKCEDRKCFSSFRAFLLSFFRGQVLPSRGLRKCRE